MITYDNVSSAVVVSLNGGPVKRQMLATPSLSRLSYADDHQ